MEFDIERDSKKLRDLVGKYETESFLGQVAVLLSLIGPPIPYRPFNALDSPMKMLTYVGGLNIYAETASRVAYKFDYSEWERIIMRMVRVKAGYYDLFLPPTDVDKKDYYEFYKVSMPVFMDYFNTGPTNFEEQEIERIKRMFSPFDKEIKAKFKLSVTDFINIYNGIDHQLFLNLNRYTELLKNPVCKTFWERMREEDIPPSEWQYEGDAADMIELVKNMKQQDERFKVKAENLYPFGREIIHCFLDLFICNKQTDKEYLYYTDINIVMEKPLYQLSDGRVLIIHDKQVLSAIFNLLDEFCRTLGNKGDRLFNRRGKYLQEKTVEVLQAYFGKDAFFYNEYKLAQKAQDRQDILVLGKGLALIIEAKAGDRVEPHAKTLSTYEQIYRNFKRNIQKGYEQCFRIKKLFDKKEDFDLYNEKGQFLYRVKTKHYHNVFNIIVTLDKFGPVQTDLTKILTLEGDDSSYPLSICIDDLETLLLAMKRVKKKPGDLAKFLDWRERLQGRLRVSDELSIWGTFLTNPSFKLRDEPDVHFLPGEKADDVFDELYRKGLGLTNEKNLDKKRSDRWMTIMPADFRDLGSRKKPFV